MTIIATPADRIGDGLAAAPARPSSREIARRLAEMIEAGVYRPGDRLREQDLVDRFGVSRTPAREALRLLEASSLIRNVPKRGATVLRLSDEEVQDNLAIREALLGLAAARASTAATDEDHAAILAAVAQVEHAAKHVATAAEFAAASAAVGVAIVAATHSRRIGQAIRQVHLQGLNIYDTLSFALPRRRRQAARDWRRIADAVVARDAARAETLIRRMHREGNVEAMSLMPSARGASRDA
jgi:DNA-binding GntR family transcriptional regulator